MTVLLSWGWTTAFAQILEPVKWEFSVHETESENELDVVFHASVDACWHVYSQFLEDPNGPLPTYFEVEVPDGVEKVGDVTECDPLVEYDPNFMMDLKFFEEEVYWVQTVRVNPADRSGNVTGFLSFMVCDASRCLPPEDIDFSIALDEVSPALPTYCPESQHLCGDHDAAEHEEPMGAESGILEPVVWDVNIYENGDAFELVFHAVVDPCWHTYSQHLESFDGPMPTAFRIDWPEGFEAVGEVTECEPLVQFDPTFEMDVNMFEEEVYFVQSFTGPDAGTEVITGAITFMACDEEKCVFPPDLDFEATFANRRKAADRPDYCPPFLGLCDHGTDEGTIIDLLAPREFLRTHLKQGVRADGRDLLKIRNLNIKMGKEGGIGSAEVRLGKTMVRCDISVMIGTPSVTAPEEGDVEFDVCLNAMCGTKYENLRNKHEDALDLENLLQSIFVHGKIIDFKDLCIESRKYAFRLCLGVTVLSHDGNLPDACILSVMAALINLRIPDVISPDDRVTSSSNGRGVLKESLVVSKEGNPKKRLNLPGIVLPVTVALFLDEEKEWAATSAAFLADPSRSEEGCVNSTLTVASILPFLDEKQENQEVLLCGIFSNECEGLGARDPLSVGGTASDYVGTTPVLGLEEGSIFKTVVKLGQNLAIEQLASPVRAALGQ